MLTANTLHKRATRVLPEVIQTSGVLLPDEGEVGIAALLFPLQRKSSGSLLFQISAQSLAQLSSNPDDYLMRATSAREGIGRHAKPFAYRAWRKAMLPLGCIEGNSLYPRSSHATPMEVYFTTKTDGRALLALIPAERLLVYVWND